jgi:putative hydrolase of the HAD superfamily
VPLRAVLLDAFGTVVHAVPSWESRRADCLAAVHASWSGAPVPLDRFLPAYEAARAAQHAQLERSLREFDFAERFARAMAACGAPASEATAWGPVAAERYHRYQEALIQPYDDPAPALDALRAGGLRLALVSNYGHQGVIEDALARLDLRRRFDAIVTSGDVGYLKPHPAVFEAALRALGGVPPREAAMVGDHLANDVLGAKRLGLRGILAPYPRGRAVRRSAEADSVLASLAELPDVLEKLR